MHPHGGELDLPLDHEANELKNKDMILKMLRDASSTNSKLFYILLAILILILVCIVVLLIMDYGNTIVNSILGGGSFAYSFHRLLDAWREKTRIDIIAPVIALCRPADIPDIASTILGEIATNSVTIQQNQKP